MTTDGGARFRTLSFGDVGQTLWGAALDARTAALVFGAQDVTATASGPEGISWSVEDRQWRLTGDGFELQVTPAGDAPPPPSAEDLDEPVTVVQELCVVRGSVWLAGTEHAVDTVGTRCQVDGIAACALDSVRVVSGWFGDDEALTLISLRGRRSAGHQADLIAATLFDRDGWVSVRDPRLSTTYTDSGRPARVNLELWVGEDDHEFPRRAAGEATGIGASVKVDGLDLWATELRGHGRGGDGTGVYVLARFPS